MPASAVTPSCSRALQAQIILHFSSCHQTPALLLAALLLEIHIFLSEEDNLDTVSHEAHENVQSQRAFPVALRGFLHINLLLWKSLTASQNNPFVELLSY